MFLAGTFSAKAASELACWQHGSIVSFLTGRSSCSELHGLPGRLLLGRAQQPQLQAVRRGRVQYPGPVQVRQVHGEQIFPASSSRPAELGLSHRLIVAGWLLPASERRNVVRALPGRQDLGRRRADRLLGLRSRCAFIQPLVSSLLAQALRFSVQASSCLETAAVRATLVPRALTVSPAFRLRANTHCWPDRQAPPAAWSNACRAWVLPIRTSRGRRPAARAWATSTFSANWTDPWSASSAPAAPIARPTPAR